MVFRSEQAVSPVGAASLLVLVAVLDLAAMTAVASAVDLYSWGAALMAVGLFLLLAWAYAMAMRSPGLAAVVAVWTVALQVLLIVLDLVRRGAGLSAVSGVAAVVALAGLVALWASRRTPEDDAEVHPMLPQEPARGDARRREPMVPDVLDLVGVEEATAAPPRLVPRPREHDRTIDLDAAGLELGFDTPASGLAAGPGSRRARRRAEAHDARLAPTAPAAPAVLPAALDIVTAMAAGSSAAPTLEASPAPRTLLPGRPPAEAPPAGPRPVRHPGSRRGLGRHANLGDAVGTGAFDLPDPDPAQGEGMLLDSSMPDRLLPADDGAQTPAVGLGLSVAGPRVEAMPAPTRTMAMSAASGSTSGWPAEALPAPAPAVSTMRVSVVPAGGPGTGPARSAGPAARLVPPAPPQVAPLTGEPTPSRGLARLFGRGDKAAKVSGAAAEAAGTTSRPAPGRTLSYDEGPVRRASELEDFEVADGVTVADYLAGLEDEAAELSERATVRSPRTPSLETAAPAAPALRPEPISRFVPPTPTPRRINWFAEVPGEPAPPVPTAPPAPSPRPVPSPPPARIPPPVPTTTSWAHPSATASPAPSPTTSVTSPAGQASSAEHVPEPPAEPPAASAVPRPSNRTVVPGNPDGRRPAARHVADNREIAHR